MSDLRFTIIGLSDSATQDFPTAVLQAISAGRVFSGGVRHRSLVEHLLPEDARWIDVKVPLADTFEQYRKQGGEIVVFASGDPLFYGLATTLRREFPDASFEVIPAFNSLQMLAHRLLLPYQDMRCASLTGRPWKNLGDALIEGSAMIGILTDRTHTPDAIARRMLDYGYNNYIMCVGEQLGNEIRERVSILSLEEAAASNFAMPNCVILQQARRRKRFFGIPESIFSHLDGREKMITKMPIRLLSLSLLDLYNHRSLWDVGFCTGSISIEARLQFPHLDITAFERRSESEALLAENTRKFGAPDINGVICDFLDADLSRYPAPDAVFIGGHGGRLPEMIERIDSAMLPGGVIVFNSVSEESCEAFRQGIAAVGRRVVAERRIALDHNNPITVMKAL